MEPAAASCSIVRVRSSSAAGPAAGVRGQEVVAGASRTGSGVTDASAPNSAVSDATASGAMYSGAGGGGGTGSGGRAGSWSRGAADCSVSTGAASTGGGTSLCSSPGSGRKTGSELSTGIVIGPVYIAV